MADKEVKVSYKVINSEMNGKLKEIGSGLQTLNKEFKLQSEQMKLSASETEKLEAKLSKLNSEHDLAAQKTKLTAEAYENAKQLMGENSKEAQQWANKLLDAQQYEERLKNSITETNIALEKSRESMSESAKASEKNRTAMAELEDINRKLGLESEKLSATLKEEQSAMNGTATDSERLERAQKGLADQSELVAKQISNLEQQLAIAKREYGENSEEVLKLETALSKSKTEFNNLENEMRDLGDASEKATSDLGEMNEMLKADMLMEFSDQLRNLSEKLVEFGQKALEAFQEVDEGMDTITTKTGASGQALEGMQQIARDISTEMPNDFSEIGNAVGEVNTQFGVTGEVLKVTSEDMLKFSAITGEDVTQSTIQAKQAMEAYGLGIDDLTEILDSASYVSQQTGMATGDLMTKVTEGAPQIKAMGLSFAEGATLIGQFEQAGVDSSAALSSLSKATVAYAKDGLTLEEGLQGTIDAIMNATDETEALNIASEVFGTKGAVRMVDAIKRGTFSLEDLAETSKASVGTLSKTFDETLDPIDKFQIGMNAIKLVMAEVGDFIARAAEPIIDFFVPALISLGEKLRNLPEPIKKVIGMVGMLVAGFGFLLPILITIKGFMMVIGPMMATVIAPMALLAAKIILIGAIIAGLVMIVKHLWETNEGFRNAVLAIWQSILDFLTPIVQAISNFIMSVWGTLTTWWTENNGLIRDAAVNVWNTIYNTIVYIWGLIGPYIMTSLTTIGNIVSIGWTFITTSIQIALDLILGILTAFLQLMNGDWEGAWETLKATLSNAITAMIENVQTMVDSIKEKFGSALETARQIFDDIKTAISDKVNEAKNAVKDGIDAILGFFDFEWSWPHLPMPHFTISGGFSLNPPSVPSFGIEWYAKGGLMTAPSIFGFNGSKAMVGGEAGPEAILPLTTKILGEIGAGIVKATGITNSYGGNTITVNAEIANDYDVYQMIDIIDKELGNKSNRLARGLGN